MNPDAITSSTADISGILVDQADRLFLTHITKSALHAADDGSWPEALWKALVDTGFPLALVPQKAGGIGLQLREGMLVIGRAAYFSAPVPLAEVIIANWAWSSACNEFQGGFITLAPTRNGDQVTAKRSPGSFVLNGRLSRVPWGEQSSRVLAVVNLPKGPHLALVPTDTCKLRAGRNLAAEPRPDVFLQDLVLDEEFVRPAPHICVDGAMPIAALVRSQQMVGAMQRCVEYATEYANDRQQFGRSIGKFQAIQQMLAEAAGHLAASTAAVERAISAVDHPDFELEAAIAKARTGEAAGKIAEIAHQIHGAMGFTREHPLHFATRRLWSWRDEYGNESYWQAKIGKIICSRGADKLWNLIASEPAESLGA
jgi:acyl-CoA dehydrogenase